MSAPESTIEAVAIIGMAGRFPGAANVAEFWANLVAGRETIAEISGPERTGPGAYIPRRGLLEKPEWFDAAFFGVSPREAEVMDPQQRVFLEECWAALEDASCDPTRYAGAIGVFAGMSNNTYWAQNVVHHPELAESVGWLTAMMGNEKDYLATRVAYKLNLRGPALSIHTACSTSLVAVCQAVQSLLAYSCDVALAGGVSITFPHERGYHYDEGGILSPDGHCRAFDANAAGTVFSNGVGVVALKRLSEALADGDHIYAVIKGAALNNDGSNKVSFTAPSVEGHAEVIALAHAMAGVDPRSIGYVEAHGTGTPLGDPIEVAGLARAFRAGTNDVGFCALGSVKTNIGHLDAAAGIAGLIKAALAVKQGKIPASLNFNSANPGLRLEESPFTIASSLSSWPEIPGPRRAGVSSFGVGGTNAHVILEEAPAEQPNNDTSSRPRVIVLSAKSSDALSRRARLCP
jgi:acyl transferase domain-containing protein